MTTISTNAAASQILGNTLGNNSQGLNTSKNGGFQDVFNQLIKDTTQTAYQVEKNTVQQAIGDMDLTKLSTDIAQLEVMVNTLVSVRDKVVTALDALQKMQM